MKPWRWNKSASIFAHGWADSAEEIIGSVGGLEYWAQEGHFLASCLTLVDRPGHHTEFFTRRLHLCILWCPWWSFLRVSSCRERGATTHFWYKRMCKLMSCLLVGSYLCLNLAATLPLGCLFATNMSRKVCSIMSVVSSTFVTIVDLLKHWEA